MKFEIPKSAEPSSAVFERLQLWVAESFPASQGYSGRCKQQGDSGVFRIRRGLVSGVDIVYQTSSTNPQRVAVKVSFACKLSDPLGQWGPGFLNVFLIVIAVMMAVGAVGGAVYGYFHWEPIRGRPLTSLFFFAMAGMLVIIVPLLPLALVLRGVQLVLGIILKPLNSTELRAESIAEHVSAFLAPGTWIARCPNPACRSRRGWDGRVCRYCGTRAEPGAPPDPARDIGSADS